MNDLKFVATMEDLALLYCNDMGPHSYFINDVYTICNAIQRDFDLSGSPFQSCMQNLHKTAAYMDHAELDMPLEFDMFLPIRLPMQVTPVFKEKERTVQLGRPNFVHPFFFGNVINTKCVNMLLQKEMSKVVSRIGCVLGYSKIIFDLSYSALSHNGVPFLHQLVAAARVKPFPDPLIKKREKDEVICIRFDFVLALEFDGNNISLPPYFKPPLHRPEYKWLAYSMLTLEGHHDPADWAVLIPKWQYANSGILLRGLNMLVMLYRLLYSQSCFRFALPASIKLGYFLTIEGRGEDYMLMSIAELMVSTLGHQVFRNFCIVLSETAANELISTILKTVPLFKQQRRAKQIYALLSNALHFNVIDVDLIYKYFHIRYTPPIPYRLNRSYENLREAETPPTHGRSRIRRRSV